MRGVVGEAVKECAELGVLVAADGGMRAPESTVVESEGVLVGANMENIIAEDFLEGDASCVRSLDTRLRNAGIAIGVVQSVDMRRWILQLRARRVQQAV